MKKLSDIFDRLYRETYENHQTTPIDKNKMGLSWLIVAAVATVVLWQFPWGNYILYPFTILATWFHEMGHGLTAMLLGGNFHKLLLYPNGNGIAQHTDGLLPMGRIARALVAAGGLMGPPIAGAAFIVASRRFKTAHYSLMFLGFMLLFSVILWVRGSFGIAAISIWGTLILWLALKSPRWVQGFAIQFLGVQACVSTFRQLDYVFTPGAVIDDQRMLSDTGQIAKQLFLPYWFWGGLIVALSLIILVQSLRIAYRK